VAKFGIALGLGPRDRLSFPHGSESPETPYFKPFSGCLNVLENHPKNGFDHLFDHNWKSHDFCGFLHTGVWPSW
jgi:hypothetical protein